MTDVGAFLEKSVALVEIEEAVLIDVDENRDPSCADDCLCGRKCREWGRQHGVPGRNVERAESHFDGVET